MKSDVRHNRQGEGEQFAAAGTNCDRQTVRWGSDGATGTTLLDCGIPIGRCCDELNLSKPETVVAVHAGYLQSGAEMLTTYTFGANAFRLDHHGMRIRLREINLAGVRIARSVVAQNSG